MPASTHPLDKPHLDALSGLPENGSTAGEEEIERRAQELLNAWFGFYLSGQPFQPQGGEIKTFDACDLLFGKADPPSPHSKPLLHILLVDRVLVGKSAVSEILESIEERWTYNALVRTAAQSPVLPAATGALKDAAVVESDRTNRRVASQVHWLLNSPEVQALALKGLGNIQATAGPREVAAGGWDLRQIVFTSRVIYHRLLPQL